MAFNQTRVRRLNRAPQTRRGDFVLYWMQAYRRLDRNHAFDYAARCARDLKKPLVVYEGLRADYPWANERVHAFILEGMGDNAARAARRGINYWPYVEGVGRTFRLESIARRAAAVVTDDFPCFIVPGQSSALARAIDVPVFAVDSNSVVPLSLLGSAPSAAAHLRPRIHRAFAEAWQNRAPSRQRLSDEALGHVDAPFDIWNADVAATLRTLSFPDHVPAVNERTRGGTTAGRARLREFVSHRLAGYAEKRSIPAPPKAGHQSGLSAYLHFGHISIEETVDTVLQARDGDERSLDAKARGKREGFYSRDADVNAFLDEAITWRDVGFLWHRWRAADTATLAKALPRWAYDELQTHAADIRENVYGLDAWEAAETHDPLWNAAQRELRATGTIHNYMRMLWGKKVIEWSRTPQDAYRTLVHLNNKYALDGRDPNSYTGILWCFGLFDRPWAPKRPVFGSIRYMSSENTARKFRIGSYLEYVAALPGV